VEDADWNFHKYNKLWLYNFYCSDGLNLPVTIPAVGIALAGLKFKFFFE